MANCENCEILKSLSDIIKLTHESKEFWKNRWKELYEKQEEK